MIGKTTYVNLVWFQDTLIHQALSSGSLVCNRMGTASALTRTWVASLPRSSSDFPPMLVTVTVLYYYIVRRIVKLSQISIIAASYKLLSCIIKLPIPFVSIDLEEEMRNEMWFDEQLLTLVVRLALSALSAKRIRSKRILLLHMSVVIQNIPFIHLRNIRRHFRWSVINEKGNAIRWIYVPLLEVKEVVYL